MHAAPTGSGTFCNLNADPCRLKGFSLARCQAAVSEELTEDR